MINNFLRFLVQTRFWVYSCLTKTKTTGLSADIYWSIYRCFCSFISKETWRFGRFFTKRIIEDSIEGNKSRQQLNNATRVRAQFNAGELWRHSRTPVYAAGLQNPSKVPHLTPYRVAKPHARAPWLWLDVGCQKGGVRFTQGHSFTQPSPSPLIQLQNPIYKSPWLWLDVSCQGAGLPGLWRHPRPRGIGIRVAEPHKNDPLILTVRL